MIRKCETCGKNFRTYPVRIRKGHGRFCSRVCGSAQRKKERTMHSEGYVMIKRPDHPRANPWGFVYEHILVAEAHGKVLAPGEIVHHKNGIRSDNRFENFEFMTNSEHIKHHSLARTGLADPVNFKRCRLCKEVKRRSEFSPSSNKGKPALNSCCRPCAAFEQQERRDRLRA